MVAKVPAFAGSEPVGLTPGFQPTMVPSSVTNRKIAGADVVPLVILKPPPARSMLNTVPVGVPLAPVRSPGVGMVAKFWVWVLTIGTGAPVVLNSEVAPA